LGVGEGWGSRRGSAGLEQSLADRWREAWDDLAIRGPALIAMLKRPARPRALPLPGRDSVQHDVELASPSVVPCESLRRCGWARRAVCPGPNTPVGGRYHDASS